VPFFFGPSRAVPAHPCAHGIGPSMDVAAAPIHFLLKLFMGPIAKRQGLTVFTAAESRLTSLFQRKFHWRKVGALVAAIAKWLALAQAAGAEPVVTGFQFDDIGFLLGDMRF
jgi:hypothetical protein